MSVLQHGLVVSRTDGSNRWRVTSSGHIGKKEGWGVVSGERERAMEMDRAAVWLNVVTYEVYVVEKTKEEKGKREDRIRKKRKRKQRKREKTRGMKRLEEEITLN